MGSEKKSRQDVFRSVVKEGRDPVEAVKELDNLDESDLDETDTDKKKKDDDKEKDKKKKDDDDK